MSIIRDKLRLILEGDVIDFNKNHITQRKYQEELHKAQMRLNDLIDEMARTISHLSRQRDSGQITEIEFKDKLKKFEEIKKPLMIQYHQQVDELKNKIHSADKQGS